MAKKKVSNKENNPGPLFIPAGLFFGIGLGFIFNNLPAGIFLGLGVGFFAFAASLFYKR